MIGDLKEIIAKIADKMSCPRVMVTRGHLGTFTYGPSSDKEFAPRFLIEVPVFSSKIVDTVGAGDAFFSITSPCAFARWPIELVAFIGNVAGALAVGIVGNRSSVEPKHLFQFITTLLK